MVGAFFCEGAGGLGPIIFGLFCTTLGLNPILAPPLKMYVNNRSIGY